MAANETIRQIMQASEGDTLPAFMIDGCHKTRAGFPSHTEFAEWVGHATPRPEMTEQGVRAVSPD